MSVTVKIPTQLRAATGGEAEVEVSGATVGEALDALFELTASYGRGSPRTARYAASSTSTSAKRTSVQRGLRDGARRGRRGADPSRCRRRLLKAAGSHPLRRARDPVARENRVDAEGAGRDRWTPDSLARDRHLRGAGIRALPARHRVPGRDGRGVRRRRGMARAGSRSSASIPASTRRPGAGLRGSRSCSTTRPSA